MYKQTVFGIKSPVLAIIFEIFAVLMYSSVLEAIYKTKYYNIFTVVLLTLAFAAVTIYIFIATLVKYEYAILDNELILRKYFKKKPQKIFSVKLVKSNCIYYRKERRYFAPIVKDTYRMYMPLANIFRASSIIVFSDGGVRTKLIFKPDKRMDEEIYRIKTAQW